MDELKACLNNYIEHRGKSTKISKQRCRKCLMNLIKLAKTERVFLLTEQKGMATKKRVPLEPPKLVRETTSNPPPSPKKKRKAILKGK